MSKKKSPQDQAPLKKVVGILLGDWCQKTILMMRAFFFDCFLTYRFLFSAHTNPIFSLLSVMGITLSLTISIFIFSVMNGVQHSIQKNIMNMQSHAQIYCVSRKEKNKLMAHWQDAIHWLNAEHQKNPTEAKKIYDKKPLWMVDNQGLSGLIEKIIPVFQENGLLIMGETLAPVMIKSVGEKTLLEDERFKEDQAHWAAPLTEKSLIVPLSYQSMHQTEYGDRYLILEMSLIKKLLRQKKNITEQNSIADILKEMQNNYVSVDGFFSMNKSDKRIQSQGFVFKVLSQEQNPNVWEVFLKNPEDTEVLRGKLPEGWKMVSWREHSAPILSFLHNQQVLLGILMMFLMALSCFLIFSLLSLLVMRKKKTIGLLKIAGMPPYRIFLIFLYAGFFLGFLGLFCGNIVGLTLCYYADFLQNCLERLTGVSIFVTSAFWSRTVPVLVVTKQVIQLNIAAFCFIVFFCLYPSYQAACSPTDSLLQEG